MYFSEKKSGIRETDEKRGGCGILAKKGRECGIRIPPSRPSTPSVTSVLRGENARGRVVRSFSRQNLVAARQKTADNYLLAESFLV